MHYRSSMPEVHASPSEPHQLLISQTLWAELVQHCTHTTLEIGGKALGRFYSDGSIVACVHIGAGPRAVRERCSFRPDTAFQQACHDGLLQRYPRLRLTLDYHLHPDGPPGLSATDHETILEILSPGGWGIDALVFMVLSPGPHGLRPHAVLARRGVDQDVQLYPLPVRQIPDEDPRVTSLLSIGPEQLQVVVPAEVLESLRGELAQGGNERRTLYGYQRLEESLVQVLSTRPTLDAYPVGQVTRASGPPLQDRELRLTLDSAGAATAIYQQGGQRVPCHLDTAPLLPALGARNEGLVDASSLSAQHVVLLGLGSVGAPIALGLAQAGVGRFTLLDPDTFSASNISRHVGDVRDLGRRKDVLLREKILARQPQARVSTPKLDILRLEQAPRLEAALADADLLVVSTDDPAANLAANRLALQLGLPTLFVGIYEGGLGGELFVLRPPNGGCYACVASFRAKLPPLPRAERAHDYLNLRPGATLPPMNALGIDIAHTVSLAQSVALGLLGDSERLQGLLTPETPLLFCANGRKGWIFSQPFELIPARLEPVGCPVCCPSQRPFGAEPVRVEPTAVDWSGLRLEKGELAERGQAEPAPLLSETASYSEEPRAVLDDELELEFDPLDTDPLDTDALDTDALDTDALDTDTVDFTHEFNDSDPGDHEGQLEESAANDGLEDALIIPSPLKEASGMTALESMSGSL